MHSIGNQISFLTNYPRSISNLYAWYRGDSAVYNASNKVSQWRDLSGNGNHLTQSNASFQPSYSASISSRKNQPGVAASGGEHLFINAANFRIRTLKTVFFVVGSTGSMAYVSTVYNGGVEYFYTYHPGPATFYNRTVSGTAHYITSTGANFFQANTHHTFLYDNVTPQLFRNNANVAGAIGGAPIGDEYASGSFYLFSGFGGGYSSTMQLLEVIFYNKALNATELAAMQRYFTERYG